MKVLKTETYLDGGSTTVFTDEGTWWLDNRLKTETKNRLYTAHPKQGGVLIENALLTSLVIESLSEYKPIKHDINFIFS